MKHYPDTVILVFAKAPVAGKVNTRLIPDLGLAAATCLQDEFDMEGLVRVLEDLDSNIISWTETRVAVPSPMARTMAMPNPPRQCPTALRKTSISILAIPTSPITMPEKMKRGIARRIYLVIDSKVI